MTTDHVTRGRKHEHDKLSQVPLNIGIWGHVSRLCACCKQNYPKEEQSYLGDFLLRTLLNRQLLMVFHRQPPSIQLLSIAMGLHLVLTRIAADMCYGAARAGSAQGLAIVTSLLPKGTYAAAQSKSNWPDKADNLQWPVRFDRCATPIPSQDSYTRPL